MERILRTLVLVSAENVCKDTIEQVRQNVLEAISHIEELEDPACEKYLELLHSVECALLL